MGKITTSGTGRVHIEDFTLDWNTMDDSTRDWVLQTFGPFFQITLRGEGVTFVYSEDTEELRATRPVEDPQFPEPFVAVVTKQYRFEVVPWTGHVAEIHVGGNDYYIGASNIREIPL